MTYHGIFDVFLSGLKKWKIRGWMHEVGRQQAASVVFFALLDCLDIISSLLFFLVLLAGLLSIPLRLTKQ